MAARTRISVFLATLLIAIGCNNSPPPPAPGATTGAVIIEIESGDGETADSADEPKLVTIEIPDVPDGATLEFVMKMIDQIPVELHGSGSTAFVHSIGDTKTDTSQGWTFKVDGAFANQGIGQTVLHPPTTVRWSFGTFEM